MPRPRNPVAAANLREAARIFEVREQWRELGRDYRVLDIGIRILRELAARQEARVSGQGAFDFGEDK